MVQADGEDARSATPLRSDPDRDAADGRALDTRRHRVETRRLLPVRYQIKEGENGRFLTCVEAPNIAVYVNRDFTVSGAAARKYPKCTIFLDGAAGGEPFMETGRSVYNLDHHEGCVRSFTLATCEQAMVLILKGLDLTVESWTVHANEPDLDTTLAIWLLLNHRRVEGDDPSVRKRMMPLIRLEGVVDTHGLDLAELTGFPDQLQRETVDIIENLRRRELELKESGRWQETDPLEFTLAVLQRVDDLVYEPEHFAGLKNVEELARIPIGSDRFAVVCTADVGIYEVEGYLREAHGDRIGLIVLQKADGVYTIRQVDPFLATSLDALYPRLNLLDPAVGGANRWGGSTDIGGSPRATGTALGRRDIADIVGWVFRPPSTGRRIGALAAAIAVTVLSMAAVVAAAAGGLPDTVIPGLLVEHGPTGFGAAAAALAAFASAAMLIGRWRYPGHFGVRRLRGAGWLALLPVVLAASVVGGAWVPLRWAGEVKDPFELGWWFATVLVVGTVGAELLFRGAVHGVLITAFPVTFGRGGVLSVPNLVTAGLYSVAVMLLFLPPDWLMDFGGEISAYLGWGLAALLVGLGCGFARERWGSVWAAVLLHAAAGLTVWWLAPKLFS